MGLRLIPVDSFKLTVTGNYPDSAKVDTFLPFSIVGEFKNMSRSELAAFGKAAEEAERGDDTQRRDMLREVLVGVHGIEAHDGTALDPKSAVDAALNDVWLTRAISDRWIKLMKDGGPRGKN